MHILGKTMTSHFFVVVAAVEVAVVLVLLGYTSPMASLTCLTVIDVKDLLPT
jgi:hypothetical protein